MRKSDVFPGPSSTSGAPQGAPAPDRPTAALPVALLHFFTWASKSFWGDGPSQIDGGDFQDKAEALLLIVKVGYDPAKHGPYGADEWGLEPGDDWYELAPDIRAAIAKTEGRS